MFNSINAKPQDCTRNCLVCVHVGDKRHNFIWNMDINLYQNILAIILEMSVVNKRTFWC
jgi:hypothetical protein